MKRIVTVTLNPAVDRTININDFVPGKAYLKGIEQVTAGGKGINVARALKIHRIPHLATGILGGCSGRVTILKLLKYENIRQDFYKFGGYSRTSITVQDTARQTSTQILEAGPRISPDQVKAFIEKFTEKIQDASFVVMSGRNAAGVRDGIYAELIRLSQKAGVHAVIDSHGKPLEMSLRARPYILKFNRKEAEGLLRRKLSTQKDLRWALKKISEKGAENVYITLGSKGAVGLHNGRFMKAAVPSVDCVNTVGCGDSFAAGLVMGLARSRGCEDAFRAAAATATANALTSLPGVFKPGDYQRIYSKTRITEL